VNVDAAYAEFADDDLSDVALAQPNAVLVRTFSKAWGLAGLRIGYAIAPSPAVAAWLRAAGSPFTAGRLARRAAAVRLASGEAEMRDYVADVRRQRQQLAALLGLRAPPGVVDQLDLSRASDEARVVRAFGCVSHGDEPMSGDGVGLALQLQCLDRLRFGGAADELERGLADQHQHGGDLVLAGRPFHRLLGVGGLDAPGPGQRRVST